MITRYFKCLRGECLVSVLLLGVLTTTCAEAQSNQTRTLSKQKSLIVRSSACALSITRSKPKSVVVACGSASNKKKTPTSSSGTVFLAPRKKVTVSAISCFLVTTKVSLSRITIRCQATQPTSTPTPTQTASPTPSFTSTPEPTPTPVPTVTPTATPTSNANILTSKNSIFQLISFNTDAPTIAKAPLTVTGLNSGDFLVSIDRRPQNGMLYGLGFNSGVTPRTLQLYMISSISGVATAVGATGTFVDGSGNPISIGVDPESRFGMDFNPVVDRIRVVVDNSQNFRMNPNTGAFVDGDAGVAGVQMDGAINGSTTEVKEAAYTNNNPNASVTTLYTVGSSADQLYIQNPPNAGTQTAPLSFGEDIVQIRGFDIPSGVNVATSNSAATGTGFGVLEFASNSQQLFTSINLATGALSNASRIGDGTTHVEGLALQSNAGVPLIALTSNGTTLSRFTSNTPGTVTTVTISGVDGSETLVGIDFRPSTGQLYGLGVNATANTASLYLLDPQTGAATVVGTTGAVAFVDGTSAAEDFPAASAGYGFNFNPTVDRIRVVTSTGLNFRINPNSGAPIDGDPSTAGVNTDSDVNGGTTGVSGTAYTNAFAPNSTLNAATQYTIDSTSSQIFIQNTPNSGTQTLGKAILLSGSTLVFSAPLGFDIAPEVKTAESNSAVSSGSAFAALTVSGVTSLYRIELSSGVATLLGTIGAGTGSVTGITAGQSTVD